MINIIENNYRETEYRTVCPHCKSVFTFGLEDLKFIEKTLDGKRVINCPCCGADFDTTKAQTDEVKGDKTCCEFCTSHACCGLTSEAAGGCEHAKNTIIGKVGIVTKTPDGKTRIPFYTGKIDDIGEIRFVTHYNNRENLNIGENFVVDGVRGVLWLASKYNKKKNT